MAVLVVSNYYPPYFIGGYELGCRDVVERLKARGYRITVLTSDYGDDRGQSDPDVIRRLKLVPRRKYSRFYVQLQNLKVFLRALVSVKPDVVYFWNQSGVSFWLAPLAKLIGLPVIFFLSDTSFVSWRVGAFLRHFISVRPDGSFLPKHLRNALAESMWLQGRLIIDKSRCQFASEFLRNLWLTTSKTASLTDARVIHWGVDPDVFQYHEDVERVPNIRLLYVGQLIPEKGVHIAVEATALILRRLGANRAKLSIVAASSRRAYEAELRDKIALLGLNNDILMIRKVERSELPDIYHAHDILIFPSLWDEPFAITLLEAMACGIPVVASRTGGSREILRKGQNCLLFAPGDADGCADAILELAANPELYHKLRQEAHALVTSKLTLKGMVDAIERDLQQVLRERSGAAK